MSKRREQRWDNESHHFDWENPDQTGSGSKNQETSSFEADQHSFHFANRGRNRCRRRGGMNRQRGRRDRSVAQRGFCQKKNGGYDGNTGGQYTRSREKEDRPWDNRLSRPGRRRGNYNRSRINCLGSERNQSTGRGANTSGDFCFERFFEDTTESSSETSDYSVSESDDETQYERPAVCPDENEVFEYFIKEIKGPSSLTKIANSNLFPKEFDISGWFQSHQSRFILFEKKGKIHFIVPFYKEATFCFGYNGLSKNDHCVKSNCPHAHVCKDFIAGSCKEGNKCPFSHNFLDQCNSGHIYKLGLNMFSNDEIRLIYSHRFPHVCRKHMLENICHRPVCAYLHICCDNLLGKCELESTCPWGHSLQTVQNQYVLKTFNLTHWKEQLIRKIIFIPYSFTTNSGNTAGKDSSSLSSVESILEKTKWYENEHNKVVPGGNNLHVEQKRKSRCRSKSSNSTHGRNRSSTPHFRQRCGQDTWNLRKEHESRRSRSRAATEGRNQSPTPYRRYRQDTSTPRVEHTSRCRSKSRTDTDRHKRTSAPYGQDYTLNFQEQKRKPGCRSKSRAVSKERRRSTSLSDSVLEMDTAQSSPVCDSYIVGKCKTAGCRHHHIDSIRLPYIWQIKMSDKWLTLDTMQMSTVERDYCNKKNTSQITAYYGSSNYTAILTFSKTDVMTAYVIMNGQVPKSVNVRRLSTASYAEGTNLSGEASFKTQWRWFYQEDFRTWCLFEPELIQFTLEQKYTTKCQETYLFCRQNFSYQIDFKQMKQTNKDTGKERELLRRPLFVSENDVKSNHYPAMISIPTGANTPFPSSWVPWDLAHKFELVKLQQDSSEFRQVENSFFTSLLRNKFRISNICRVQNMDLWTAYCGQKKSMKGSLERDGQTKMVDEKSLFHGTDSLDSVRGICTNCFDFRVCGKNATVYGKGAYFACDASYSNNYTKSSVLTKERYMFLAKVLVGEYTVGSSSYTRPPNKPGGTGHLLFDSCVDSMNKPSIFVVFDLKQCYPEYLISYINLEEVSVREAASVRSRTNSTLSHVSQSAQSTSNLQRTYSSSNLNSSPAPIKRVRSILKNSSTFTHPASLQNTVSSSSSNQSSSSDSTLPLQRSPTATSSPSSDTVSHPASLPKTSSSSIKSTSSASLAPIKVLPSTTSGPSTDTVSHTTSLQRTSSSSVKSTSSNSPVSIQMSYSVTSSPSSQTSNNQVSLPRISSSSSPSVPLNNITSSADLQRPHSVASSSSSYAINHSNLHTQSYGVSNAVNSSPLPSHRSYDYGPKLSQGNSNREKKSDCCIL
ncbi:hypothetical protein ACJMK2_010171 [Sinanodonta woodiana]|uniref:Uncharacterized protein n=1 Tax=Sinanodonta woodiana TaxID=1069815 RepID=A0ABD3VEH6_SINWO